MEVLAGTASRGSFRDRPPRCVLQHGSPAIQFASGSLSSLTNDPACTRGRQQASQVAPALQDAASHFPAQQRDVAAGGRGGRLGTAPLTSRAFRTAAVWPANSGPRLRLSVCGVSGGGPTGWPGATEGVTETALSLYRKA